MRIRKEKIGEKKKENWQNPELADKMMKGLEKATLAWQKKEKMQKQFSRHHLQELWKNLFVQPHLKDKRLFCSQECSRAYPRKMSPTSY